MTLSVPDMVEQSMNTLASESFTLTRLEGIECACHSYTGQGPFGVVELDRRLQGGIPRTALHEVYAAASDAASGLAFALLLAWRGNMNKPIFLVQEAKARHGIRTYGHGLAELGIPPQALFLVDVPNCVAALRAGADVTRCSAVGAVIIETMGKAPALDLTASRRLALAARHSGVMTLLLRTGVEPVPSAAHSRWRVASVPSTPFPANAPGLPAFEVTLLRHRGGIAGIEARLEWNRDRQSFETPLSGGVPAAVAGRTGYPLERRAA